MAWARIRSAKVDFAGRITIPIEMRRARDISQGDRLEVHVVAVNKEESSEDAMQEIDSL